MDKLRAIIRAVVLGVTVTALCGALALFVITDPGIAVPGFSRFDPAPLADINEGIELYDADGNFICKANRNGYGKAEIDELPEYTKNAFIAIEDARFYEHGATDPQRIVAALAKDIATMSAKEGASTITQQLAKNAYLSPEKTLTRKVKELRIAREIEQRYTKDEILEMYLNSLYFGNNIYGIETAARRFFAKPASELTLDESASLAAIINNPKKYDPFTSRDAAEARKKLVLERMEKCGHITESERIAATAETRYVYSRFNDQYFINLCVRDATTGIVQSKFNKNMQIILENALTQVASRYEGEYIASALILDAETALPIAAASNTYLDLSRQTRSPGSTIKPLLCYIPALEEGLIAPVTPLSDVRTDFNGYTPKNYGDVYRGWVSASECVAQSLNVPAVKLLDMVGIENAKRVAEKMGLTFDADDKGLALALGGMTKGLSLDAIGRAYCFIADGGKNAIRKETAYLMTSMLRQCAKSGTAKILRGSGVAAKTGTVGDPDGDTDAYCVAYDPHYVVIVHAQADKLPSGLTGGTFPAKVCREIMERPEFGGTFVRPKTVVNVDIDAYELYGKHRVVAATSETLPKDRISAEFSIYHTPEGKASEDLFFGDYENFKIVDGFVD